MHLQALIGTENIPYTQSQFENFCATDPLRGLKPAVDTVSQQIPQVKTKITGSGSCILSKV